MYPLLLLLMALSSRPTQKRAGHTIPPPTGGASSLLIATARATELPEEPAEHTVSLPCKGDGILLSPSRRVIPFLLQGGQIPFHLFSVVFSSRAACGLAHLSHLQGELFSPSLFLLMVFPSISGCCRASRLYQLFGREGWNNSPCNFLLMVCPCVHREQ